MGCSASFLFKPEDFEKITHYNESFSAQFGRMVTVTKNIDLSEQTENGESSSIQNLGPEESYSTTKTYIELEPRLELTFLNRLRRCQDAFPAPLDQLVWLFRGIEFDVPRLHSQTDTARLSRKGKRSLTYLEVDAWDKTLREEFMVRKMKKKKFDELELWNLLYCAVVVLAQMERAQLPIDDELGLDSFVIKDGGFVYVHKRLYDQKSLYPGCGEAEEINIANFQNNFNRLMLLLMYLGLMEIPFNKMLKIYEIEMSYTEDTSPTSIMEELFSVMWAKYNPHCVKSGSYSL